jgi:hypothetical protein
MNFYHRRVTGIVAKIGSTGLNFAKLQDVREAISHFRNQGKKTIAFADSFGEFSAALPLYWLASYVFEAFLTRQLFSYESWIGTCFADFVILRYQSV